MIDLITNKIKKHINPKGNVNYESKVEGFRSERQNSHYLNTKVSNKSKFINKALYFYILVLENPLKILMELKKRYPEQWKYVNRRKFAKGGKKI